MPERQPIAELGPGEESIDFDAIRHDKTVQYMIA